MLHRCVLAVIFTVVMCIVSALWLNSIQPQVMSDLVIAQLEQSDAAAHALRNAQTGQQYVYATIVVAWVLGILCIFKKYIALGCSLVKGYVIYLKEKE